MVPVFSWLEQMAEYMLNKDSRAYSRTTKRELHKVLMGVGWQIDKDGVWIFKDYFLGYSDEVPALAGFLKFISLTTCSLGTFILYYMELSKY